MAGLERNVPEHDESIGNDVGDSEIERRERRFGDDVFED